MERTDCGRTLMNRFLNAVLCVALDEYFQPVATRKKHHGAAEHLGVCVLEPGQELKEIAATFFSKPAAGAVLQPICCQEPTWKSAREALHSRPGSALRSSDWAKIEPLKCLETAPDRRRRKTLYRRAEALPGRTHCGRGSHPRQPCYRHFPTAPAQHALGARHLSAQRRDLLHPHVSRGR